MSETAGKKGLRNTFLGIILLIMVGLVGAAARADDKPIVTPAEPTQAADTRECPNTWLIAQADNENNRWFASGIREIQDAKTAGDAEEAIDTWLRLVRRDPQLLSGTAKYFLDRDVDPSTLEDGKCASEDAETLTTELAAAIAESDVTPSDAPEDGYNSGADADGNVVAASDPGITGNRHAVKVVTKDGKTIWVMARCGNPVVKGKPPVPPGPTDEPEKPREKSTTTTRPGDRTTTTRPGGSTTTTTGLTPKDPSQDINNNPGVPPQKTKTGPSPDNQSEIDKGPTQPVDSPTGCNGPCPTTATTRPSSGGTSPGQGSTDNGTTTPPTTSAPSSPAPPTSQPPQGGVDPH